MTSKNSILRDEYGDIRLCWIVIGIVGAILSCITPLIAVSYYAEIDLIKKMDCNQLLNYITNNADSGIQARWNYHDRCMK